MCGGSDEILQLRDRTAIHGLLSVLGVGVSEQLLGTASSLRPDFEEEWLPGYMARFDMETGALDTIRSYDLLARAPPGMRWNPIGAAGWVAVASGQFVYARSDRPQVTWHRPDGTVAQIVRWQAEAAPLTEELLEGLEAGFRAGNRLANPGASAADIDRMTDDDMARYRAVLGGPMPLFTIPFGDSEGRVWLPSYRPGDETEGTPHYTVISADGEWLGTVEAPPRFRILDVAGGLVLGVQLDDMDVENVVVYELVGDDVVEGLPATGAHRQRITRPALHPEYTGAHSVASLDRAEIPWALSPPAPRLQVVRGCQRQRERDDTGGACEQVLDLLYRLLSVS